MRAVVFRGIGDVRLEAVPEPRIEHPLDAIVRLTAGAICGTDLHLVRGTMPGMTPGTILGHEGVGIVEAIGAEVRNLEVGDRIVIAPTVACGYCSYCRAGYFAQCDVANPNGNLAGPCLLGGTEQAGGMHGLLAEKARIPYAHVGLVRLPEEIPDEQAILLSDVLPTAFFGVQLAEIKPGNTVAVFGCGPVGLLAIACAGMAGAGRVLAVDTIPVRLELARRLGAEVIDYEADDPVEAIRRLTGDIGVDRAIEAVGVDANHAHRGPAAANLRQQLVQFQQELQEFAPPPHPPGDNWHPGDGPSQALHWAVQALAKAGTLAVIGGYPRHARTFPIGEASHKNLSVNLGICHHRRYIPPLIELVLAGAIEPSAILTRYQPLDTAIDALMAFDRREPDYVGVEVEPVGLP